MLSTPEFVERRMESIVYASFDRVPAPKGAAVHIDAFARALGTAFGRVDLVTVADPRPSWGGGEIAGPESPRPYAPGVLHHPLPAPGATLLERVLSFRTQLGAWWGSGRKDIVHVRSIYEGYPVARAKERLCRKLVFEVNGLPSIELKYHYPGAAEDPELLRKLIRQEQACLLAADLVLTVSRTTAGWLERRGVPPDRIRVIPNGVDTHVFAYQAPEFRGDREMRWLYSGTLAAWQGVWVALEALALFVRDAPARLTFVGPARTGQRERILERAWELGVSDRVTLLPPVPQAELARLHHDSDAVLAPLMPNDRNLEQGCCPLKVLEAMASGVPLVASDLPVVRELVEGEEEALLVRPGSAKAMKDGLLRLRQQDGVAERLSRAARRRVERDFTWSGQTAALVRAYEDLGATPRVPSTLANAAASMPG